MYGKHWRMLPALALAFFTRDVLFLFGLLVLLRRRVGLSAGAALLLASLLFPLALRAMEGALLGQGVGELISTTVFFGQKTSQLFVFLYAITSQPFGYIVTFPLILAIEVASPFLNYTYYLTPLVRTDWAELTLVVSSGCFVALLVAAWYRAGVSRLIRLEAFQLFVLFSLLVCLYPYSQHRYLLPVYPVVVLTYLSARRAVLSKPGLDGPAGRAQRLPRGRDAS